MSKLDGLKKHFKGDLKWWREYFEQRRESRQKFRMQNVKVQKNLNASYNVHYYEIGFLAWTVCLVLLAMGFFIWLTEFKMRWGLW